MEKRFKILYFVGMVMEIILRAPYARQRGQVSQTDQRVTCTEQGLLAGLTVGTFLLPIVFSLTSRLDFANYRLSSTRKTILGKLGMGFLSAAIWLFWRSHHDLGTNWSPSLEINTQQTLVTQGVYRTIRHPMYASQLLWSFAQALLLPNWIVGLGGLATFLPFYFVRIPREEQMMLDHFGDEYQIYCDQTGRIFPRL